MDLCKVFKYLLKLILTRFYKKGIFPGACNFPINHIVLLVGYGTDENGID